MKSYVLTSAFWSICMVIMAQEPPYDFAAAAERCKANPTRENMIALGGDLRGLGRASDPLVDTRYLLLRETLLSLPGHAQYFADALEAERAALKPGEYRSDYERNLHTYLAETLCHLPSPETVKVLGAYLNDERDTGSIESRRGNDVLPGPTVPLKAMKSLCDLGIEGCPVSPRPSFSQRSAKHMASLETMRKWYEKIKSGEQAFSFKGQSVEYRFNPDGTWLSTPIANPPDDAPAPPPAKPPATGGKPSGTASALPPATAPAPVSGRIWPWMTGGVLTVFAALGYFIRSRRQAAAETPHP